LNVEELHFAHDDSELAKISAKPNFAGIKAKGTEYAKNMKTISAAIANLNAEEIKEIQNGKTLDVRALRETPLELDFACLMIVREVAEGLAVEADESYTVALDLKITPELRLSCMARELVNRIQNRRKDMDLQITDKIKVSLRGIESELQAAVEKHKNYILEETQAVAFSNDETGEWVSVNIEGNDIQILVSHATN